MRPALALATVLFLFENNERAELVCQNFPESNLNAELQRRPNVYRSPDESARLCVLRRVQVIEGAMSAAAAFVRCIRAQARIAQLIPAQPPVNEESDRRQLRPLAR